MNPANPQSRDSLSAMVQLHADQLAEHFESVQIFAVSREDGGELTTAYDAGAGSWYSRHGAVWEWLEVHKGQARAKGRAMCDDRDESL